MLQICLKEKYFWLRVALIVGWLAYGIGLALHLIHVLGGWENPLLQTTVPRLGSSSTTVQGDQTELYTGNTELSQLGVL